LHLLGLEKEVIEGIQIDVAGGWCTWQEASPLPTMPVTHYKASLDTVCNCFAQQWSSW